jgi:hypothetical protein
MSGPELKPSGVTSASDRVELGAGVDTAALQATPAATLQQLSIDHVLFTDALLHTKVSTGPLNLYVEFCNSIGRSLPRFGVSSDLPFFSGLEIGTDPTFNHWLWYLPRDLWPAFETFMGQVALLDRDRNNLLVRIRTQSLQVIDALALSRKSVLPAVIPTVPVTAFVLDSNQGCAYFYTPAGQLLPCPAVYTDRRTYADTEVFAAALTDEHAPDPYKAVDQLRSYMLGRPVEDAELERRRQQERTDESADSVPPAGD